MATQHAFDKPVSIEGYLATEYEHDCEYVDGVIEERNLGEFDHAYVQGLLVALFLNHRDAWKVFPLPEQRVQTRKAHFRVPNIAVLREGAPREQILRHPPLPVIEVQSPDIPLRKTAEKALEYLASGIEHVWVIDPYKRRAYRGTANGLEPVPSGELSIPGTSIRVTAREIFAELGRMWLHCPNTRRLARFS